MLLLITVKYSNIRALNSWPLEVLVIHFIVLITSRTVCGAQ